ncbi:hypothetical protein BHE90_017565 [Fusarium euwallaceae]|uniref:Uncharacterized protein n=1 Tax=Fusarium euwallaceae TaxID=1147111 RepID=A0A430KX55_9HYPO|nr:hypothetical protein BHE90_017565 [Fusarium euwallaceae]
MEDSTVRALESKDETAPLLSFVPFLHWEIPWIDPTDVRLVLRGLVSALRRKYYVVRHDPDPGSVSITQLGDVCIHFVDVLEEQRDEEGEGRQARYQHDMIKELISGVLGHMSLWLRGEAALCHEWIQRGVLCPKTIYDAWAAFSETGSLADLEEAIIKAKVVLLRPGAWTLSEMTKEWVRAWKARQTVAWLCELEDVNVIESAEG